MSQQNRKGTLITIEGLDGSGKGTQAQLLFEALQKEGFAVRKISFPNYDSPSSALTKMYLNGEFGNAPGEVNAYAASSFFSVDRYATYKKDLENFYQNGGILITDRYTTSNAVHQCCKLPRERWDAFLEWLFDFEYQKLGIPAPDKVIYLSMSVAVSEKLLRERYKGDTGKEDIHEKDKAYLAAAREGAAYCAAKYGWHTIVCDDGQTPRPVEVIHHDVMAAVRPALEKKR